MVAGAESDTGSTAGQEIDACLTPQWPQKLGWACVTTNELLTGRAAPYQQARRFGSRARNQVHVCVAGGAGKRLFQDPSAKQEVPGISFCVCDGVDLTV